tara:strand:+ start:7318 stop:9333 length:2016 start_codon:yes stop_codon:yes gene_type:complete
MDYKDIPILRAPYVKGKGFLPNPLVVNGIPDYADSSRNPKCVGTPEYETFWSEQLYRCINGYNTGGIFIPGRFYYYMNFNNMNTVHGIITPDFCDMHLELCYIIEWCMANGKNIIIGKKRRAGISEFTQKAKIDYGYRFSESYQAGIAAGQKKYAEDFMTKWEDSEALLQGEFRVNSLLNNPDEVVSGYELMDGGKTTLKNNACKIFVRTMHNNPNMFKGLFLNDVVAEEAGEFENLCEFISATNDCLMDGDTQVGMFMIYGTGGNINKGSKDFKKVWENPNDYNAVKYLITGDRFKKPFYGGATRFGKDVSVTPNLLKKYKPYQIIGMEDTEAAMENIMEERERLKKGDLKKYMEHLQNNPINEAEIFRKMFSNNFDIQKINAQQDEITVNKNKYSKWKLEWVTKEGTLERVSPLRVKAIPAKDTDDEGDCILILDEYHPDKKYKNLYVGGIDPYDQDKGVSKSLGAMCVMSRPNTFGIPFNMPVAVICTRPKRKEIFFDMCLKLSVYYDLVGNTLGDKAGSSGIIKWYENHNCMRYLAPRPKKFESMNSEQSHEFWVSLNTYSRPLMVGAMQTSIHDYSQNIWFPELINQLGNFDEVEIGSDNDLADAYGIALMQSISVVAAPRDDNTKESEDPFSLGNWITDKNGNVVPAGEFKRPINPEEDHEYFGS